MKKMLMGVLVSLMSVTAMANMGYIKGGLGMSFGGEFEIEDSNGAFELESSVPFFVTYGYNLSEMLAVEAELSFRNNDAEFDKDSNSESEASVMNFAVNGVFTYPMGMSVTPYFGGGLTVGTYEFGSLDSEMGIGLQVFGGASYAINNKLSIGGDLRYLLTVSDPEVEINGEDKGVSYSHFGLLFNLKYSL